MSNPFDRGEPPPCLSVSQLNRQVKSLLESHFDFIWVEGEISNLAKPSSGHWYFSLKDGSAQVRCAMFRNRNQRVRLSPDDGDQVRLRARVSLYEGRGEFQLIVEHLEPAGTGALQIAFEKLKARLLAEGLFDTALKRPLPDSISHLGVITSASGAAIHDILTVLARRDPTITVKLVAVAVQGDGAAQQIASALEQMNRWQQEGRAHFDAIIVGRGGGSLEDLWAFNEERVALAIADSDIPIVAAVGHEVDFSIADMVADARAPTPSAAAELVSTDRRESLARLAGFEVTLARFIARRLNDTRVQLEYLRKRLKHPGAQLQERAQRIDDLEQRLVHAQKSALRRRRNELTMMSTQLQAHSPLPFLRRQHIDLDRQRERLASAITLKLKQSTARLRHLEQLLHSLSPLQTLQRGYAIISDENGKVLTDAGAVNVGDKVSARLAAGALGLDVTDRSE
ncbi:MAG: exodeoxyribonuclease VII large subunit [Pseudomonadota bacterium]